LITVKSLLFKIRRKVCELKQFTFWCLCLGHRERSLALQTDVKSDLPPTMVDNLPSVSCISSATCSSVLGKAKVMVALGGNGGNKYDRFGDVLSVMVSNPAPGTTGEPVTDIVKVSAEGDATTIGTVRGPGYWGSCVQVGSTAYARYLRGIWGAGFQTLAPASLFNEGSAAYFSGSATPFISYNLVVDALYIVTMKRRRNVLGTELSS